MATPHKTPVAIWGGYGGHNLGDEAILWAVDLLIQRYRPGVARFVLVRGEVTPAAAEQYAGWGIEAVRFPSLKALRTLRKTQVIAGGGQLVDDKGLGWPVGWTSLILVLNRLLGNKPLLLCIGCEPVRRALTRWLLRHCYTLAGYCVCRDSESSAVMRNNGTPEETLITARDVVFSVPPGLFPSRSATNGMQVTVVVSHDAARTPGNPATYLELARQLQACGFSVLLIAHDVRAEYDMGMLEILASELSNEAAIKVSRPMTVKAALEIYAASDFVISGRMHPLILSALAGAVPVAISDTAKVRALVQNLELPALPASSTPKAIAQFTATLALNPKQFRKNLTQRLGEFRKVVEAAASQVI